MQRKPVILVTGSTQQKGSEFGDLSLSLSEYYSEAILAVGGAPLVLPAMKDEGAVATAVQACDGVLLTGGDDIEPSLYTRRLAPKLKQTVVPAHPKRDLAELWVIREVFARRKPLLGICRGHQLLNVALGGDMVVDIGQQRPQAINHRRSDLKDKIVHQITLAPDSLLARITGGTRLGVNSSHHQAVGNVGDSLRVVGTSPDGIVEAMELKTALASALPFLITVQYHPERLFRQHQEHLALFLYFVHTCAKFVTKKRR